MRIITLWPDPTSHGMYDFVDANGRHWSDRWIVEGDEKPRHCDGCGRWRRGGFIQRYPKELFYCSGCAREA